MEEKTQEVLDRATERKKESGRRLQELAAKGRFEKVRRPHPLLSTRRDGS